jgi:hypothetical protein
MAGATALRELTHSATGEVRLAVPGDDAELRSLMRRSVIPGAARVAFTREPSFFEADGMAGANDTTVVARANGRLTGLGRVSVLSLIRNGGSHRIGYLGSLRVADGVTSSPRLIRDGYELLLRESDPSAIGFFTSIAADNVRARRVLEHGGRFGIPEYRPLADLVTLVAPVSRYAAPINAGVASMDELTAFLESRSRHYQLGLSWDGDRWNALRRHGVAPDDFVVVRRGGSLVACAAVWDQGAFKQTVIDGYEGMFAASRPVMNAISMIFGRPVLPQPGNVLRQGAVLGGYANTPDDWRELWPALLQRARALGVSWMTLCRDARDPELAVLRRLTRGREYLTTLYDVQWRDGPRWTEPWSDGLFRPEVGLL